MKSLGTKSRSSRVFGFIVTTILLAAGMQPAYAQPGLGGGAQFASGTVFPFIGGVSSFIDSAMNVQNLGQYDAQVEFSSNVPAGVSVTAISKKAIYIRPGAMVDVPFRISVTPMVAPGTYEILSTVKQINVANQSSGTTYAPAIGTKFYIQVFGSGSTLTVRAINIETKKPIQGQISLYYVGDNSVQTLLENRAGSTLRRTVVPGNYVARFEIPGLTQKSVEFEVVAKSNKTVYIGVHALEIIAVKAEPIYQEDGSVNQVDLTVSLRNGIARLPGPIKFSTKVYLNGELTDSWNFSTLPELSVGLTEQKNRYVSTAALAPGSWKFIFEISTEDFKITSNKAKPFIIEKTFLSSILAFAGYALVVAIWSVVFWLLWRRRKKDKELEQ